MVGGVTVASQRLCYNTNRDPIRPVLLHHVTVSVHYPTYTSYICDCLTERYCWMHTAQRNSGCDFGPHMAVLQK